MKKRQVGSVNRLYLFDLLRMQDFLEQNFRNAINVEDVARAAGYSSWHCRRIFKQYLDESIPQRLLRLRLEAGKKELRTGRSVKDTAAFLGFCSREGFTRAFTAAYGISPGRYAKGEETRERYREVYEYRMTAEEWSTGANPTQDGLWEFSYYNKTTGVCRRMYWSGDYFEAPYRIPDVEDPAWYCQNRFEGYGMHPGKERNAIKSFICPKSGLIEYFISLGRLSELYDHSNPCSIRLYHEWDPLFPIDGPLVLSDRQPVFFRGVCRVTRGDRISLCLDALGHMGRDGVALYRQQMGYLEITEE